MVVVAPAVEPLGNGVRSVTASAQRFTTPFVAIVARPAKSRSAHQVHDPSCAETALRKMTPAAIVAHVNSKSVARLVALELIAVVQVAATAILLLVSAPSSANWMRFWKR